MSGKGKEPEVLVPMSVSICVMVKISRKCLNLYASQRKVDEKMNQTATLKPNQLLTCVLILNIRLSIKA